MAKKKHKWSVTGTVVGGKYLGTFEAATAEEAIDMALEQAGGHISLCHQCSSECEDGIVEEAVASRLPAQPEEGK